MNKKQLKELMADPLIKEAMKDGGYDEVARMISSTAILQKDPGLRRLAVKLGEKSA